MERRDLHEDNRQSWNAATVVHNSHKIDQAGFLRGDGSTLFPEEIDLLGDLTGKSLLHLQCNAGQDTLSLAKLGAVVTGVDISDEAIAFAQQLSIDSGIPGTFIRSDIYDWLASAEPDQFDVVFTSYGVIGWLSDIDAWGQGIAKVLKPGGRFVLMEFHPFSMSFSWDWQLEAPYFDRGNSIDYEHGVGDYVALSGGALSPSGHIEGEPEWVNPHPGHEFQWGVGEIVTSLLDAGLTLTTMREYPYSNGAKLFNNMRETPGRRMIQPEGMPNLPLMLGIVAEKRA